MSVRRDDVIQVRVSSAEKARIVESAAAAGLRVSEWVRQRALVADGFGVLVGSPPPRALVKPVASAVPPRASDPRAAALARQARLNKPKGL